MKGGIKKADYEGPELTSSHRHTRPTATYGLFSSEKDLKTRWTALSQTKDKGDTLKQVGEAETGLAKDLSLLYAATLDKDS